MRYLTTIGVDVHLKQNVCAAINRETGTLTEVALPSEPEQLIRWIKEERLPEPIRVVYESGPTGFELSRALEKANIRCIVAATAKLPYQKGRQKNDRNDARWLGRMLDAGLVREVRVPSPEEESLRDLSRLRAEISKALRCAKQRVSSFLMIKGIRYTLTKNRWTDKFYRWANTLEFPEPIDTLVFREKFAEVKRQEERLGAVDGKIKEVIEGNEELSCRMARFMCISGIGPITAFAIACEVVDFSRFKNGAAFAAFLGLVPLESSTGDTISREAITKAGNSGLRCLLIEASKQYSKNLHPKQSEDPRIDPLIRQHAYKCSLRLLKRREALKKRRKAENKATTAIARELAEWIYWIAIM